MSKDKDARIAELEQKLAEQQAEECNQLLWRDAKIEELTTLLAKAKEEGRKEAVPEGWQVVPREPTDSMWFTGQDIATYKKEGKIMCMAGKQVGEIYKAMLAAAPKPQGE